MLKSAYVEYVFKKVREMKKLTMKDIGMLANVSQSTVSRVLSGHPNVKKEVRERVLKCIEENEFSPDISARIMRGEKSKILAFVSAGFENPFYLEMVGFVEREARRRGYTVIVMNSEDDEDLERYHFKELITRHVDGIISAPVAFKNLKFLKKNKIPFVVLNENVDWVDSFYTNLYSGGEDVAKFFKEKNLKKVAYLGEEKSQKYKGFLKECSIGESINNPKDNVLFSLAKDLRGVIKNSIEKINFDCDGYFFSSDTIALLFLEELKKIGKNLDNKVLVGYDNTIISKTLNMSSVEQPMDRMAEEAIQLLLNKILKNIDLDKIYNVGLEPRLIKR